MTERKFAVFDIDGTLIRWQLYHAVVDRLAKQNLLGKDAGSKLRQARMHWKQREHPEAFREYELELIAIYEEAFEHLSAQAFDRATQEIITEYGSQTYTYTRQLITRLKDQGYYLLAISGSHNELIEKICKQYGFDDWVGTSYERSNDRFTGNKSVASHNKKAVLGRLIEKHNLSLVDSLAIGDSGSDIAMLQIVEQPIAFNPDQKLYQAARQNGWKIVVERKNVVYELGVKDEQYTLA